MPMERGAALLLLAALGGLVFIICSPSLFSLVSSGVAYDTSTKTTYRLRTDTLLPLHTKMLYPSLPYISFADFASLPMTNYTIKGSAVGNGSFGVLILDSTGYSNFVSGSPSNPLASATSTAGENKTFQLRMDQSKMLYLVVTRGTGTSTTTVNIVTYYEYYEQTLETISVLSITKTVILPAASVAGLITLIVCFVNLRSMAKKAREEAEKRELYTGVSGSSDLSDFS